MTAFFDPGSILEPTLVKAAISETRFPVARATRNGDFMRRRCGVARWLRNSGCSSMERTLLGFHAGISFFGGGVLEELTSGQEGELPVGGVGIEAVE